MNNKQIESLKQGKVSLALKLKRQHSAGLMGDITLYKSYSEGNVYLAFIHSFLEVLLIECRIKTKTKAMKVTNHSKRKHR